MSVHGVTSTEKYNNRMTSHYCVYVCECNNDVDQCPPCQQKEAIAEERILVPPPITS